MSLPLMMENILKSAPNYVTGMSIWQILLAIWLVIEVIFYINLVYFIYPELNRLQKSPQHEMDPKENMIRGLETLNKIKHVYSFEKFFTGWFKGAKMEDIKEGNVEHFLAWTTYQRSWEQLAASEKVEIREVIQFLNKCFNISFPKGYNKDIKFIMMTHEAVMFHHKPFLFYALIKLFNEISHVVFRWYGYERYAVSDMVGVHYWYRPNPLKSREPDFRPSRAHSSFSLINGFSFLGNNNNSNNNNDNNNEGGGVATSSPLNTRSSTRSRSSSTRSPQMDLRSNDIPSLPPGSVRGATLTSTAPGLEPKINLNLRPFSTATEERKSDGKANNNRRASKNTKDGEQIKTNNFNNINETINETDNDNESVDNYPLIFFHGISPGLCCYLPFLMNICKDRASIFIEIPHVTTMLNFTPHQHSTMTYAVEHILDRHHIKEAAVMGHSFGSIVAKVIACSNENIKQLILVDPVCLLLCLPDVAYNFLYWEPISKFAKFTYHHLGLRGEITISNALRRHFWWYENILWLEDLPCDLIVALPEFDGIIPVDAIKEYLESFKLDKAGKGGKKESANQQPLLEMRRSMSLSVDELPVYENDIRLIVWRNYFHGRVLFEESGQQELLDEMREQQLVIHKRENAMALQGDLDDSLSRRQSLVRSNTYKRAPSYSRNISFF